MKPERYRFIVTGIVQGVGFRPFVYKLAKMFDLKGWVSNTGDGVLIDVEGDIAALNTFREQLENDAPALSEISEITSEHLETANHTDFVIIQSSEAKGRNTHISPDVSICDYCLGELQDIHDRRYRYPFINCTNCGPRFTITTDIPYDRPNTTMSSFEMCSVCRSEYTDPYDRRYHAQPIACSKCGPQLSLLDGEGKLVAADDAASVDNPASAAGKLLAEGYIIAVKGLGGYHLSCDARNKTAVAELRKRKHRDEKPFALMCRDIGTAMKHCEINDMEKELLQSVKRPVVLLKRKQGCILPSEIAPHNPYLGIMLPYTPLHHLLFDEQQGFCDTLVMTSGNRSSEPICYKDAEAFEQLKGIADYFLVNNREIYIRTDDSVTRVFNGKEAVIRRSRGYVPTSIRLDESITGIHAPSVLACGGEMKNTFSMSKSRDVFISHHIGDLENLETMQSFEEGIEHFGRIFDIQPDIVAYDLHPEYLSTKYAQARSFAVKMGIQHHHAHIAACMAENKLAGEAIGVAFDGTGYGEDDAIWGGEFFTGSYNSFKRAGHLDYVKMPGGSAAAKEPWRMALSYLHHAGIDFSVSNIIEKYKSDIIEKIIDSNLNSPLTSSMGRLFDAVAALAGIRKVNSFEGQAAMELEYCAVEGRYEPYQFCIMCIEGIYKINVDEMIAAIYADVKSGVPAGIISARFHETVARMVDKMCCRLRDDTGLDRVVLSGGVFQNMLLLGKCIKMLSDASFKVFTHSLVPCNDGGLSLGQAVIAMVRNAKI